MKENMAKALILEGIVKEEKEDIKDMKENIKLDKNLFYYKDPSKGKGNFN